MRRLSVLGLLCWFASSGCAGAERWNHFTLQLGREHPLSGRVYDVRARSFVSRAELERRVEASRWLILGETHDNPDHHLIQAELLKRFLAAHGKAAVAFEMLDEDEAAVLAARSYADSDALARDVRWQDSGWPDFGMYRPVFDAALHAGATLVAASPGPVHVRASMAGVPPSEASALKLDVPLPEAARQKLEREIVESHCGVASPEMVQGMARAQSYKDAYMARALRQTQLPAALITGRGHAANDRGVPRFLRLTGSAQVTSIGLIEVATDATRPEAYPVDAFDLVLFTPRTSDEDACVQFRAQLRRMQAE